MPQITVGLAKWLEGQEIFPSIVTKIRAVDRGKAGPGPQTLIIPAGPRASVAVDLAEGRYLFEAFLPNGDVATTSVTVKAANNDPVVLRASDSAHEWLSWQDLAGHAPARRGADRTEAGAVVEKVEISRGRTDLEFAHEVIPPTGIDIVRDAGALGALLARLQSVWKGEPLQALPLAGASAPLNPRNFDPALGVTSYLFGRGPWEEGVRYYAFVRMPPAGPPLLAVLPIPWFQADATGGAIVDLLVDASDIRQRRDGDLSRHQWPVRVSVVVRDHVMAAVFGYLTSGDLPAAAQVVETAVDRLEQKLINALAAAGAAYILVRTASDERKRPIWVPWLKNLRVWFPWLPDGAILDGWAHLNGIGREPNVAAARAAFVDAVGRGLPFYAVGVRLLFEGMTRIAASSKPTDDPDGFGAAFEIVRRLALRVDVRQTFTVVRLS
jgi:hypothetical protein